MAAPTVTLLEDLLVEEISLVDEAANLRDGWAALKSARLLAAPPAAVVKASAPEHRTASAVVYEALPAVDAHGEGAHPATLSVAMLRYALKGRKTLRLQHEPGTRAGEVVALASWPESRTAKLCTPEACASPTLQPFTVFSVARFSPAAFRAVKEGARLGLSIGGRAVRVRNAAAAAPRADELPEAGWLWTSDGRIAAVAEAAGLPGAGADGVWEVSKSAPLDALWGAVFDLGFLEVEPAAKAACPCGGRCGDSLSRHARERVVRSRFG